MEDVAAKIEESTAPIQNNVRAVLNEEIGGFSLGKILSAVIVLIIGLFVKTLIKKLIARILKKTKMDEKVADIVIRILDVIMLFVVVMIAVSTLGINMTSLIAIVTALSLSVTLALNDILANVAGGMVIISSKCFAIGDYIDIGGMEGTVKEIHITHTRILTIDNQLISIPNKEVSSSKIVNYTANPTRRTRIVITASYDAPTELVKKALMEAITDQPEVLADPAPFIYLTGYGESAIEYTMFYWTNSREWLNAKYNITERIREKFGKYGVELTYNHINVHMIE